MGVVGNRGGLRVLAPLLAGLEWLWSSKGERGASGEEEAVLAVGGSGGDAVVARGQVAGLGVWLSGGCGRVLVVAEVWLTHDGWFAQRYVLPKKKRVTHS